MNLKMMSFIIGEAHKSPKYVAFVAVRGALGPQTIKSYLNLILAFMSIIKCNYELKKWPFVCVNKSEVK